MKIDARGLTCPLPVIKTKKALKDNESVTTIVDNDIATQNLKKLAEQLQYHYEMKKVTDGHYITMITRSGVASEITDLKPEEEVDFLGNYSVVIDTNIMGRGSDELGLNLMKAFIYSLTEQDILPETMIFYNSGVKLTVSDSDVLEDLINLSNKGVTIYSCGACLDFYGLTKELAVGEVTNMYRIVEMIRTSNKVMKP